MAIGIKTGGRQKGTPNRLTFQVRQVLANVLADEIDNLPETLSQLEPAQKIDAICKLSKFVLPALSPVHVEYAQKKSLRDPIDEIKSIESAIKFDSMLEL